MKKVKQNFDIIQNEVSAWARMSHPNIVTYFDNFTRESHFYIVMEYVNGTSLRNFILNRLKNHEYIEEQMILKIFAQVISALQHCKKHKVIHRGIKPENIIMKESGDIMLIGFSVSEIIFDSTKTNPVSKSYHYIPPEIINGESHSFETDVWSLGYLIYQLICLVQPFQGLSEL
jgi:serine/threonine-protein kinase